MRVNHCLLFLTLVVSPLLTVGAPNTTTPMESTTLKAESDPLFVGVEPGEHRNSYFTVSLGFSGGHILERDQYHQGPYLSLRYHPLREELATWDYEAQINTDNLIGLGAGYRWYCCPEDPYNPYLRLSANMIFKGSDEIGGVTAIRRWRARASAGIGERFISEFGVGLAVTGADLFAQFGFNF